MVAILNYHFFLFKKNMRIWDLQWKQWKMKLKTWGVVFFVFDIKNFSNSQFRAYFGVVVFCACTMLKYNIVKIAIFLHACTITKYKINNSFKGLPLVRWIFCEYRDLYTFWYNHSIYICIYLVFMSICYFFY